MCSHQLCGSPSCNPVSLPSGHACFARKMLTARSRCRRWAQHCRDEADEKESQASFSTSYAERILPGARRYLSVKYITPMSWNDMHASPLTTDGCITLQRRYVPNACWRQTDTRTDRQRHHLKHPSTIYIYRESPVFGWRWPQDDQVTR